MQKPFLISLLLLCSLFLFITCNTSHTETVKSSQKGSEKAASNLYTVEGIDYQPYSYKAQTPIPPKPRKKALEGGQAIAIAEQWIANQGYTTKRVDLRKQSIVFEEGEFATDTNDILRARYNTLRPYAFGVRQYGEAAKKWAVGFEYVHAENNIGRAVTLDSIADTLVMQPTEVRQDWILGVEIEE